MCKFFINFFEISHSLFLSPGLCFVLCSGPLSDGLPCRPFVSARAGANFTLISQGRDQNYDRPRKTTMLWDRLARHMGPNNMESVAVMGTIASSAIQGLYCLKSLEAGGLGNHVTYSGHFQVLELRVYFIFFCTSLHSFSCSFHSKIQSQDRIMILHQLLCQVGKF